MARRPTSDERDERRMNSPRVDDQQAARGEVMPAVEGIIGDQSAAAGESRSGEDVRRRGWFWHWNSIVTQFAPIIGLKGIGLLNSYTVWTDRRENSPHRGFAFPSQQSEADFYGEDRNELITINKILVALDLIEIRKVMVPRTSVAGHKWKVPHNLYRVKDHGDEFNLTVDDVRRVVSLAEKDRAVYRYVRRIFSPRFSPIDSANVWHDILEELRPTESWKTLALRTERDEHRASARSKAGHESRRSIKARPLTADTMTGDKAADKLTAHNSSSDSGTAERNDIASAVKSSAELNNNGLGDTAELNNNGLGDMAASIAAPSNTALQTSVQPTNTTYYQELTTTTDSQKSKTGEEFGDGVVTIGFQGAPDDQRDEDSTVRLFEEANGRVSTPAQRRHLRTIATSCAELAHTINLSGWRLTGEAIEEAVSSGSSFVAPKRIREILARWEREGLPDSIVFESRDDQTRSDEGAVTTGETTSHRMSGLPPATPDRDLTRIWDATCSSLAGTIPSEELAELRRVVTIATYADGVVTLNVSNGRLADSLESVWLDAIQRKVSVVLRRPVRVVVATSGPDHFPRQERSSELPHFVIPETGMSNGQVWMSVVDDLRAAGALPRAEFDSWLRDSVMLAFRDEDDVFVIGLPHQLGVRRAARFRSHIEDALIAVIGFSASIDVVRTSDWLLERSQDGHIAG